MCLYRGSSRGMRGSPEDLGLLAVAGPQTYSGTLGQPADFSYCQSPHCDAHEHSMGMAHPILRTTSQGCQSCCYYSCLQTNQVKLGEVE